MQALTATDSNAQRQPDGPSAAEERRTSPVELLWDLVFVFAVTQVTRLLYLHLSWSGLGQSMLVLALIWWAWSAFVWAANAQSADSPALRICLLAGTVFILVTGLALPQAFSGESTLFAGSYAVVRVLHLTLYADASRRGDAAWSAIAGFGLTVAIGMALLVAGSFVPGPGRTLLWLAAVAIDYAGPAWITRERLRGLQRVAVAHFAERYSLFVIICLGESIVTVGLGARGRPLTGSLIAAVILGLLITVGLWWTYFDRFAQTAERSLREHGDPVIAAADAYSYLHLMIVAGIIIFAAGVNSVVHRVDATLSGPARLALCGGVALYLLGHAAFLARLVGELAFAKLLVVAAALLLWGLGGGLPAWSLAAGLTGLLAALCAWETVR